MFIYLSLLLLLLSFYNNEFVVSLSSTSSTIYSDYDIQSISFNKIGGDDGNDAKRIQDIIKNDGIIAITDIDQFENARNDALTASILCALSLDKNYNSQKPPIKITFPSGVHRYTWGATSTNKAIENLDCPNDKKFSEKVNRLRTIVETVTQTFVKALDKTILLSSKKDAYQKFPLLKSSNQEYNSFESMVNNAEHLDHFHVYVNQDSIISVSNEKNTLEMHTDNGLFVAFVPSIRMGIDGDDISNKRDGFNIKLKNGREVNAKIPKNGNAIVIMFGDGIYSLNADSHLPVYAVPHSLSFTHSTLARAWFGRMFLLPKDAILENKETVKSIRDKAKNNISPETGNVMGIGCSGSKFRTLADLTVGAACKENEMFCWMACRSIADLSCTSDETIQCIDSVSGNTWVDGDGHCTSCAPKCVVKPTAQPTPSSATPTGFGQSASTPTAPPTAQTTSPEQKFCNGYITDMYMEGFVGVGDPNASCLVFLFQSWVLDTPVKYAFGAIGCFLVGIFVEFIVYTRREIKAIYSTKPNKKKERNTAYSNFLKKIVPNPKTHPKLAFALSLFIYLVQITFAYFAMLLAMTFAAIFFTMIVLGLVTGHGIFNETAEVAESAEPCCAFLDDDDDDDDQINKKNQFNEPKMKIVDNLQKSNVENVAQKNDKQNGAEESCCHAINDNDLA